MSTLYIRLPSRFNAGSAAQLLAAHCPFALVSDKGVIEGDGLVPLSNLSGTMAGAQRVIALVAANDVTLLRIKIPPLSPAKLKAALPNLVEDKLIDDPAECVVVAGGLSRPSGDSNELRTIAVVQRAWLKLLAETLFTCGARQITALPAQLCLAWPIGEPNQSGRVIAAIDDRHNGDQNAGIEMALRLSEHDGIGLAISVGHNQTSAHEAMLTLCAIVPEAAITLCVPQSLLGAYQEVADGLVAPNNRITLVADTWSNWMGAANVATPDLMAGLAAGARPAIDWHVWRWPLALLVAFVFINITALNIDWWRMKSETHALRSSMLSIYKSVYPKETVILDPIAQMQQKISAAQRDSGQGAPDDFTALAAAFGEAWSDAVATAGKTTAIASLDYRERSLYVRSIASLDYRERSLYVRLKPGEAPTQQIKAALAKRGLTLTLAAAQPGSEQLGFEQLGSGQSGAIVWQIGSAK